jgi:hypothetical protein
VYGVSKSGKVWKRRPVKRRIQCPLCPPSTQWISRHIRQCHKLSSAEAQAILSAGNDYRRRTGTRHLERVPCPVLGCPAVLSRLKVHMRHKHSNVKLSLGLGEQSMCCASATVSEHLPCRAPFDSCVALPAQSSGDFAILPKQPSCSVAVSLSEHLPCRAPFDSSVAL